MRLKLCLLATALALGIAAPARAADSPAVKALQSLFAMPKVDPAVLDPSFSANVPLATLQDVINSYKLRMGPLAGIEPSGDEYLVKFAAGSLHAAVTLSPEGAVKTLSFHDEQDEADRAALVRVFAAPKVSEDWFAPSFLKRIPAKDIDNVMKRIREERGSFVRLDTTGASYSAVFERGRTDVQVTTDLNGKITDLFIAPFAS